MVVKRCFAICRVSLAGFLWQRSGWCQDMCPNWHRMVKTVSDGMFMPFMPWWQDGTFG